MRKKGCRWSNRGKRYVCKMYLDNGHVHPWMSTYHVVKSNHLVKKFYVIDNGMNSFTNMNFIHVLNFMNIKLHSCNLFHPYEKFQKNMVNFNEQNLFLIKFYPCGQSCVQNFIHNNFFMLSMCLTYVKNYIQFFLCFIGVITFYPHMNYCIFVVNFIYD